MTHRVRQHRDITPEHIEADFLGTDAAHLVPFANLAGRVVGRPLLPGNDVKILRNGDEAFPEMLRAIRSAEAFGQPEHLHL